MKMEKETIVTITLILTLITLTTLMILGIRIYEVYSGPTSDTVCKNEYGVNWTSQFTEHFGSTCIKLDYITLEIVDRKSIDYWEIAAKKGYCNRPRFLELSRRDNGCKKWSDVSEVEA